MSSFFDDSNERNVLPNWRSFRTTLMLGESDSIYAHKPDLEAVRQHVDEWQDTQSIGVACDILSSALVYGVTDTPEVRNIAKFILENSQQSSAKILEIARCIFSGKQIVLNSNAQNRLFTIDDIGIFREGRSSEYIYPLISLLKIRIRSSPNNAITWVDLSRAYTLIGQMSQATRAMKIAAQLGSNNRFVLRALARFSARQHDLLDYAHDTIRKNNITTNDPWLSATEIALAQLRGRRSKFVDVSRKLLNADINPFHLSELASAIGTLEMENGNTRESRKHFIKSLIRPNDNALAQAEWVVRTHKLNLDFHVDSQNIPHAFEALAREAFRDGKYELAIQHCANWFLDLPFSKHPLIFASYISSLFLEDNERTIRICKIGLVSHPNDPDILNNIALSYCLNGDINNAEKALRTAEANSLTGSPYLAATRGLYCYRRGFVDIGREKYLSAINDFTKTGDRRSATLALGYMAREEMLLNSSEANLIYERFIKASKAVSSAHVNRIAEILAGVQARRNK